MHAVIMFFVNAVVYFLELGTFTTTLFSEWAVFTICFATSVRTFGVAFTIGFFAFEKQFGLVASCIDSLHVRKVDQRSNHGFYRFASHSNHFLGIFLILGEFLVHAVVMFFVIACIVMWIFAHGASPILQIAIGVVS